MDFAGGNGGNCSNASLQSQGATARTDACSFAWSQKGARDPYQGALPRHPPPVQPALPLPGPVSLASMSSTGPGDELPFPLNEFDPPAPPPWPPGGHVAPNDALSAKAAGRAASGTLLDMADGDWQSQVSAANSSWQ